MRMRTATIQLYYESVLLSTKITRVYATMYTSKPIACRPIFGIR